MTDDVVNSRISTEVSSWKRRKLVPADSQPPRRVLHAVHNNRTHTRSTGTRHGWGWESRAKEAVGGTAGPAGQQAQGWQAESWRLV